MTELKITTKMNGKMQGMVSINTSPLNNKYCQAMSKKDTVCAKCYSQRMMKMYKSADKCFQANGKILSERLLTQDEIPWLNYAFVRLNAHGELINSTHLANLYAIARKNPHTSFVLWTKRIGIIEYLQAVMGVSKPKNFRIILSSKKINQVTHSVDRHQIDKVFTVFDKSHKDDELINCGKKQCAKCMICYDPEDKTFYVNEILK